MTTFPFSRDTLAETASVVYDVLAPTPQYAWPLLAERTGLDLWVKHENHTPTGSFKVRGGLGYMAALLTREPDVPGVIAATRGNHGQSVAFAARRHGIPSTVVVPHGNSREKNAAMRAFGAELIEHGADFQEALEYTRDLARERGLHFFPSFDLQLLPGIATYALEFFEAVPQLDAVYVPIGQGSGICSVVTVRDLLGLDTRIVGVVAASWPAYQLSFEARAPVSTAMGETIADGVACRVPDPRALEIILAGVDHIVAVTETEIRSAMRAYFTDTHQVVEGAGAASLAAVLREWETLRGQRVGVVVTGGNVDIDVYAGVLSEPESP